MYTEIINQLREDELKVAIHQINIITFIKNILKYIKTIEDNKLRTELLEYIDNEFYIISDYTYFTYIVSDIECERISTDMPYLLANRIIYKLLNYK